MTWAEMLAEDAVAIATDTAGPFEQADFLPKGVQGDLRQIRVAIVRRDLTAIPESPNLNVQTAEVLIPNDAETGTTRIYPNEDRLSLIPRLGGNQVYMRVRAILAQTQAFWLVTVQA